MQGKKTPEELRKEYASFANFKIERIEVSY